MGVTYKGIAPKISIQEELLDDIKLFFSLGKDKTTIFLSATKKANTYHVEGWYLPKQNSTEYLNVIPEAVLAQLGEPVTGEDGNQIGDRVMSGIARGGQEIKGPFENTDIKFAEDVFYGVDDFFAINFSKDGSFHAMVFDGLLCFSDVKVEVKHRGASKERVAYLEKFRRENVHPPEYRAGGSLQQRRKKIFPSPLLTDNKSWKEVV